MWYNRNMRLINLMNVNINQIYIGEWVFLPKLYGSPPFLSYIVIDETLARVLSHNLPRLPEKRILGLLQGELLRN